MFYEWKRKMNNAIVAFETEDIDFSEGNVFRERKKYHSHRLAFRQWCCVSFNSFCLSSIVKKRNFHVFLISESLLSHISLSNDLMLEFWATIFCCLFIRMLFVNFFQYNVEHFYKQGACSKIKPISDIDVVCFRTLNSLNDGFLIWNYEIWKGEFSEERFSILTWFGLRQLNVELFKGLLKKHQHQRWMA